MMEKDKAIEAFSYALGAYVHHPDYYKGPWAVRCTVVATGETGRRVFDSHADATAFVDDMVAQGVCTPGDGKYRIRFERAEPLPGFPMSMDEAIKGGE
jgi:hypothetical protein